MYRFCQIALIPKEKLLFPMFVDQNFQFTEQYEFFSLLGRQSFFNKSTDKISNLVK